MVAPGLDMPATLRWLMDGSATEPLSAPVARDTGGTAESDCLAGDDSFEESLAVAMRVGLPDPETEARAAAAEKLKTGTSAEAPAKSKSAKSVGKNDD